MRKTFQDNMNIQTLAVTEAAEEVSIPEVEEEEPLFSELVVQQEQKEKYHQAFLLFCSVRTNPYGAPSP